MMKAEKGFTLVELIVVIAIIAILASVSIVGYNQFIRNARDSRAETELNVITRQLEAAYYVDSYTHVVDDDSIDVSYNPADNEFTVLATTPAELTVTNVNAALVAAINAEIDGDLAVTYVEATHGGTIAEPDDQDTPKLYLPTVVANDDGSQELVCYYWTNGGVATVTFTLAYTQEITAP